MWFGFLIFILVGVASSGEALSMFFIVPIVMGVFGFALFKRLVWDLADEVLDAGNYLIFKRGDKEQVVKLEDIINISYTQMSSPERVTVHVRSSGPIGKELAFSVPVRFNPFSKSPIVSELIERVDKAKRR